MKTISDALNLTATDMSANLSSEAVYVGLAFNSCVQVVWTGTPTGALKVQASLDAGQPNGQTEAQRAVGVTNWTDVPSMSTSIAGAAGSALYELKDLAYNFVRVVYTASSGAGTVTIARIGTRSM